MEFQQEFSNALESGEKTLEEIKALLPEKRRGKVLDYLAEAKRAGVLTYVTKKVDGKFVVVVRPNEGSN